MTNLQIAEVLHFLFNISDIIFTGLKVFIPLLFLLIVSGIGVPIKLPALVLSTNILLLASGLLFTIGFLADSILTFSSDDPNKADFIMNILSGPHWYQYILPVFNYALLPQLLWIKKFRKSIYSSFIIVLFWLITFYITVSLAKAETAGLFNKSAVPEINYPEIGMDALYVTLIIALIYFFRKRK